MAVSLSRGAAIIAAATEAEGLGVEAVKQITNNKLGKYTANYQQNIDANNLYAVVSAASYIFPKDPVKADEYVSQHAPGYLLDHNLSDNEHVVAVNHANSNVVVGFRGTDAGLVDDLKADLQIATMGTDYSGSERFELARARLVDAKIMYPGFTYEVTGHSLGGSQAMWVSRNDPRVKAVVFNPGIVGPTAKQTLTTGLTGVAQRLFNGGRDPDFGSEYNNITVIRTDGDFVSAGYWSRLGTDASTHLDEAGKNIMAGKDGGSNVRPYGTNGVTLVNAKYEDPDKQGLAWSLAAHSLDNFLTPEQAMAFNDSSGFGEDAAGYAERAYRQSSRWKEDDTFKTKTPYVRQGNPVASAEHNMTWLMTEPADRQQNNTTNVYSDKTKMFTQTHQEVVANRIPDYTTRTPPAAASTSNSFSTASSSQYKPFGGLLGPGV